ncbi:hypothetical protein DFQ27_009965 [Actinomortierella ambigua]|uniref:Methylmalonyl Co-A mutase-associated GTPase MeaB n=1 Tax=Actinomortierella ambigua TaxID=1343610 RepID=A0A9P6UA74_9FUNG|nr:hypothetical protein DFQ27_009965 [Actinomortierella ambigua]
MRATCVCSRNSGTVSDSPRHAQRVPRPIFPPSPPQRGYASAAHVETPARRDDSAQGLFEKLIQGDRYALARAITLVESSNPTHRVRAQELLSLVLKREANLAKKAHTARTADPGLAENKLLQDNNTSAKPNAETPTLRSGPSRLGRTFRVGLSGPPGVGKSTFIEAFGMYLVSQGHRVAVLAVDPSSARTGGSILGDKTRMTELSRCMDAYVRPSPSRGTLAAGYDICLVETVGVGQSETMVAEIVDMFVLLVPPAGGDELQGMKKGIMELSDLVIVNKADGALLDSAMQAQIEYTSALKFVKSISDLWKARVIRVSSRGGPEQGIANAWDTMKEYFNIMEKSGDLQAKRGEQRKIWMWRQVSSELMDLLHDDTQVRHFAKKLESKVLNNEMMSGVAAHNIVQKFLNRVQPGEGSH